MTRQERIDRNRDRNLSRAASAQAEATQRFKYVDSMAGVMNGTPILIGHHSEKGHRRDIARMDDSMRKGIDAHKTAARSARAASQADSTGISIQDSDAAQLLAEKIAKLEKKQALMKAANRIVMSKPKNALTEDKVARIVSELGLSDGASRSLCVEDFGGRCGFPGYELTNNNANIKRLKGRQVELSRIAEIQDDEEIAAGAINGNTYRFVTDTEDKRVRFESQKPGREACKLLAKNGFKWSPRRGCWVRLLNLNALNAVRHWLAPALEKL